MSYSVGIFICSQKRGEKKHLNIQFENEPIDDKKETATGEAETSRDKENTDDETKKSAEF